jgi:Ca2+/Na+ antiporter
MILGNLMGSVIIPASLILGLVAIIHPISNQSLAWIADSRMVLLLAIILFFVFTRSSHKISQRESLILLLVYLVFIMTIIFYK